MKPTGTCEVFNVAPTQRTIFIVVPSPHPTGPIKGAFALANALAPTRRVVLVYLKDGPGADANLDSRVEEVSLSPVPGWLARLRAYQRLLRGAGGRENVVSLSMCFSADLLNRYCSGNAVTCSSVRGNVLQNYRHDYGTLGLFFAFAHLFALRSFDRVVAMTEAMATQLNACTGVKPMIIGNFVDEQALECFRSTAPCAKGAFRFVCVGSLTSRKQPTLVLHAIKLLISQGHEVQLDMIGDGPLMERLSALIVRDSLKEHVKLHGHIRNPYPLIAGADAFILSSLSEGVSRAALEALYLGVPCVLRNVDGNADLLSDPAAGELFSGDVDLPRALIKAASRGRARSVKSCLLPPMFRQSTAAAQYLQFLEAPV